ncbi:MAG: hypothetical protein RSA53_08940 [Odoribacter sp.]
MKKYCYGFGLFIFLLLPRLSDGQNIRPADRWFEKGAYYKALEKYQDLIVKHPNHPEAANILFRAGVCCLRMGDYAGAQEWLEKAEGEEESIANLYQALGEVYLVMGRYQSAKESFCQYREFVPDDPRIAVQIASCDFGMKAPQTNPNITISTLPLINTRGSEYGILFVHGGILYSSTGDIDVVHKRNLSLRTGMGYSKPYLSTLKEGEYQVGVQLKGLSKRKANEGSFAYDLASEQLFCTRCEEDQMNCQIIRAKLKNFQYQEKGILKIGKGNYNMAHPFIYENGNCIYFSSTMEGGYGGSDIWSVSRRPDGRWEEPVNLGANINTAGNEVFPYLWEGSLFFASDGHIGYGGLDIYLSRQINDHWGEAFNLGAVINSSYDDFNLIMHQDGKGGLLVSNRIQEQSDDIFRFEIQTYMIELRGSIKSKEKEQVLSNACVHLITEGEDVLIPVDEEGNFSLMLPNGIRHRLTITAPGYQPITEEIRADSYLQKPFSGEQNRLEKAYFMETMSLLKEEAVDVASTRAVREGVVGDSVSPSQEMTLKEILQNADLPYSLKGKMGELSDPGWWVQVAMLMQSKIISYDMASQMLKLTGKEVVMYRGEDGGHRFYLGVYASEEEARQVASLLKEAGVATDCFIKKVTE